MSDMELLSIALRTLERDPLNTLALVLALAVIARVGQSVVFRRLQRPLCRELEAVLGGEEEGREG
jgi:hypothetical protein